MKQALKGVTGVLRRSLSVVIAFSMILSICAISAVTVSGASNGSLFSMGDYFYVSTVDVSGIGINGNIKCHMYRDWPDNSGAYIDSVDMLKISDNYYRCHMFSDDVRYLKFMLNNDSNWWIKNNGNPVFSIYTSDNDNNPLGSASNNCIYIQNYSADYVTWGSINNNDPDNTLRKGTYQNRTASLSSNITSNVGNENGKLTLVDGVFYDYYNNDEMRNGWITGLDGSERTYRDREPFTFFNNAIANHANAEGNSGWAYPLYFGDFNRASTSDGGPGPWGDGYRGAGVSNLSRYNARANNSNKTSSGTNGAVSGLVDSALSGGIPTSGGVTLPYFDTSFLSQGYGATVNSKFVFRNEIRNKDMYHVYDSTGGKDNFYFTNLPSGSPTAVYYQNSNQIYDAASGFGGSTNGAGFFPFDTPDAHQKNAYNFGFGMKLTIPFVLRDDRKTENGNNVMFNFSGDDDLWVYIDGNLVLDMGGAHKMASGSINFTNNTVTVHSLDTTYGTKTTSISNVASGKAHTMTVFYMERGMIESNCKIEYNFDVLDTLLTTEKEINTANVNSGLVSAVKEQESFKFTNTLNGTSNTSSQLLDDIDFTVNGSTGTYNSDGSYNLKDGDTASFADIAEAGNYLTVKELGDNGALSYSTTYSVTDEENNRTVTSGSGTTANFKFQNTVNSKDMTNFNVKFVNTPQVGTLNVKKVEQNSSGAIANTGKNFTFTIKVDLNGGTAYTAYPLTYTVGSNTYTANNGIFTLKGGQTAVFNNIPLGATYQVVESVDADYTVIPSSRTATGTVSSTSNTTQFINKKINKTPASVVIEAGKLLDNKTPDVNDFKFTLTPLTLNGSTFTKGNVLQTVENNGSSVKFETIEFAYEDDTPTQPATTVPVTTVPVTTVPVTTVPPTTAPKTTKTITVGVISYVYNETSSNTGNYQVHYWGGSSGVGDASCTSTGKTESRSVGSAYWNNSNQTFRMYTAEIPNDATGFKFHIGDRWFGDNGDANSQNAVYIFNYSGDKALYTTVASSASYNLIRSAYSEPSEEVNIVGGNLIQAGGKEYYYYEIAETALSNTAYTYDSTKFYAVVTVNRDVTPNKATVAYYTSQSDAINNTNAIDSSDVVFNNYHKGSVEITKTGVNNTLITDTVKFTLYKANSDGGSLSTPVGTKTVDKNGKVEFENLDLFVNQANNGTQVQWYCFVETVAKDGYNIDSTKHYFTVPYSQLVTNQNTSDYDFVTDNKKYKFVPDERGNLVYNLKFDIDNYAVVTPDTSGTGINSYLVLGVGIIGTGAMLTVAYNIYDRVQRKKRKARYKAFRD